jgi:hypothetical protein
MFYLKAACTYFPNLKVRFCLWNPEQISYLKYVANLHYNLIRKLENFQPMLWKKFQISKINLFTNISTAFDVALYLPCYYLLWGCSEEWVYSTLAYFPICRPLSVLILHCRVDTESSIANYRISGKEILNKVTIILFSEFEW